ncbi:MAG: hypothetical protein J7L45_00370 [Candidatus Aenigmarchaeota archaeon]|nr:hypothetical protein [Candidatus Aenigmarchaeota archaeon]
MKKGLIAEIAILASITVGLVVLVLISFFYSSLGVGTVGSIKFTFESGYSNELSTTTGLITKSDYPLTRLDNLISEYAITGDDKLIPEIKKGLEQAFKDKYVELTVEDKTITIEGSPTSNYVIIYRRIPLLGGNSTEAKIWVYV